MASLYQKRGIYYLAVNFAGNRKASSLRTSNYQTAKELVPIIERKLLLQLLNDSKTKNTNFPELIKLYIKADHGWSKSTKSIHSRMLKGYLKKGYPKNLTSRSMTIRSINACNRWGFMNKLIPEFKKKNGGNEWNTRQRIIQPNEIELLFTLVKPDKYRLFLMMVYYTGARVGEIRTLKPHQIYDDYIEVQGKSGLRIIKLNKQAKEVLNSVDELWDYTANYIELTWSRNRKRLGLNNIRMHDLRRTFGYNLIKQGRPIYEVSKLLGHSSVTVTERHYAPLMTTEIEEFML